MTNNEPRANDRADAAPHTASDAAPSYLRRLTHTPMRDLLRLRASGRLDIDAALASSGLPASTQSLIKRVVKKTRLWPLERAEVAHELIAHFRDAAERADPNADPGAAERAFGEPRAAAKLIARAKRRNRPLPIRYTLRAIKWGTAAALVLACVYAYFVVRFYGDEPTISRDYIAELNAAALTVPEHERAAPLYAMAANELRGNVAINANHLYPGAPSWDTAVAYLKDNCHVIDNIHEAASYPALGYVLTGAPDNEPPRSVYDVYLTHLNDLRRCQRALFVDTRIAAAYGDAPRVQRNLRTMPALAHHARETPFLIADLVSIAIAVSWADEVAELLARDPSLFTEEDLRSLGALARSTGDVADVRIESERMLIYDFVQRSYTDDGKGDGRFTAYGIVQIYEHLGTDEVSTSTWRRSTASVLLAPAVAAWHPSRRELLARADAMFDAVEAERGKGLWERDDTRYNELESLLHYDSVVSQRYIILSILMPALTRATTNGPLAQQRLDALKIALALELFRRENGRWPESLHELTPGHIAAVPLDQFDGKPLRYRLIDGEPILYSVGVDRVDNGGSPFVNARGEVQPNAAGRWMTLERVRAALANPEPQSAEHHGLNADWVLFSPAVARRVDAQRRSPVNDEAELERMYHWDEGESRTGE